MWRRWPQGFSAHPERMRWGRLPWASPISFGIWGQPTASSQPWMHNRPHLQSSSAPCRHLFLFRDIITITAGVTTFCHVSSKETSKFPQATWKFTPFFTPSDTPQTAVLGLLQCGLRCLEEISGISDCNTDCFRRWYWQTSSQCCRDWCIYLCWDWSTVSLALRRHEQVTPRPHELDAGGQVSSSQEPACQLSHNSEPCPSAANKFGGFLTHIQCHTNPDVP